MKNILIFLSARPEHVEWILEECVKKYNNPQIAATGSLSSVNFFKKHKLIESYIPWGEGFFTLKKGLTIYRKLTDTPYKIILIPFNNNHGAGYFQMRLFASVLNGGHIAGVDCRGEWHDLANAPARLFYEIIRKNFGISLLFSFYNFICFLLMFICKPLSKNSKKIIPPAKQQKEEEEKKNVISHPVPQLHTHTPAPALSIIIRTMNEERFIKKTLDMIFRQKETDFEVIIVDSGSNDRTVDIVKQYPMTLVEIPHKKFTYGYSLNAGACSARGEILVHLSAHAVPVNDRWLGRLTTNLKKHQNAAGVYGREIPLQGHCNPIEKKHLMDTYTSKWRIQKENRFFSNSNAAVRRSVWEKFPFKETLMWAEDQCWAQSVQEAGYVTIYDPDAAVYHSHNLSIQEAYKRALLYEITLFKMNNNRRRLSETEQFRAWWNRLQETDRFLLSEQQGWPKFLWLLKAPFYEFSIYAGARDGMKQS